MVVIISLGFALLSNLRLLGLCHTQEFTAASEFLLAVEIGKKAVISNTLEALWGNMGKKATDEFIGCQRHRLLLVDRAIVLPPEAHLAVFDVRRR